MENNQNNGKKMPPSSDVLIKKLFCKTSRLYQYSLNRGKILEEKFCVGVNF